MIDYDARPSLLLPRSVDPAIYQRNGTMSFITSPLFAPDMRLCAIYAPLSDDYRMIRTVTRAALLCIINIIYHQMNVIYHWQPVTSCYHLQTSGDKLSDSWACIERV